MGNRLRALLLKLWPPLKTRYLEDELRRSWQRIRELERRPVGANEWRLAGLRAARREVSAHEGWAERVERLRIRRELKAGILGVFEQPVAEAYPGELGRIEGRLLTLLDRICPEEHPTPPAQEAEGPAGTSAPAPRS